MSTLTNSLPAMKTATSSGKAILLSFPMVLLTAFMMMGGGGIPRE